MGVVMTNMGRRYGDIRIHAHIEDISTPFDGGAMIELKLKLEDSAQINGGECRIRVPAETASAYYIGQELCGVFNVIGKKS